MKFSLLFLIILVFFINGCSSTKIKDKRDYATYFNQKYIKMLDFQGHDLVATNVNNQWYYVRKDGKAMPVMSDDRGSADKFKEGLARTKINGKIGFFNRDLDMVIEPFYDFAFPFHKGISDICVGCKEVKDENIKMLDGGDWKRINRSGLIIEE
jgi:hypothetical protein